MLDKQFIKYKNWGVRFFSENTGRKDRWAVKNSSRFACKK